MQFDDQFVGLTNRLQHFAFPASESVADTFTTVMVDVHNGWMSLLEHQQSITDRDHNLDATISNIRDQYGAEVTQARIQAQ